MKTTLAEKAEKAAAAFCAAAATLTLEVRAAGVAARKAARRAAEVPFRETRAAAAQAAAAARAAADEANRAADRLTDFPPDPVLLRAHAALFLAAEAALEAADLADPLA